MRENFDEGFPDGGSWVGFFFVRMATIKDTQLHPEAVKFSLKNITINHP